MRRRENDTGSECSSPSSGTDPGPPPPDAPIADFRPHAHHFPSASGTGDASPIRFRIRALPALGRGAPGSRSPQAGPGPRRRRRAGTASSLHVGKCSFSRTFCDAFPNLSAVRPNRGTETGLALVGSVLSNSPEGKKKAHLSISQGPKARTGWG